MGHDVKVRGLTCEGSNNEQAAGFAAVRRIKRNALSLQQRVVLEMGGNRGLNPVAQLLASPFL